MDHENAALSTARDTQEVGAPSLFLRIGIGAGLGHIQAEASRFLGAQHMSHTLIPVLVTENQLREVSRVRGVSCVADATLLDPCDEHRDEGLLRGTGFATQTGYQAMAAHRRPNTCRSSGRQITGQIHSSAGMLTKMMMSDNGSPSRG
jgi:hypothetical protein